MIHDVKLLLFRPTVSSTTESNNKALYYVIPKSNPNQKTAMILNGKEAKTVLLSTNNSASNQSPIVVLANGGPPQNHTPGVHPNPMQLLPVLSSAVTSVAAAKPHDLKVTAVTSRNGETNNNRLIYPWHSLVPFLVSKGKKILNF